MWMTARRQHQPRPQGYERFLIDMRVDNSETSRDTLALTIHASAKTHRSQRAESVTSRGPRRPFVPLTIDAESKLSVPALEANDLLCVRDDEALFAPLQLRVERGALLVLEGNNGSGKTTLLRALLGLNALQATTLQFLGEDVLERRHALRAGSVWMGHLLALKGDLSARENLEFTLALAGEAGVADADPLFAALGLAGFEDVPARTLSAGQRKRAALARLAASRRPLWLLDEPFANLDAAGMAVVEQLLRTHLARGGSAILTSHGVLPISVPASVLRLAALP